MFDDKAIYDKTPAKYDRAVFKDSTGGYETYIERQPAHVISEVGIESVLVRKAKTYGGTPKKGAFYDATFKIRSGEAKRFTAFTEKNKQGRFQLKLGKRDLGVVQLASWPFEANKDQRLEFTVYLAEYELNQLKEIFLPFKGKVAWE